MKRQSTVAKLSKTILYYVFSHRSMVRQGQMHRNELIRRMEMLVATYGEGIKTTEGYKTYLEILKTPVF